MDRVREWLDLRIGYRRIREVLLDEPLPPGTGWLFTLGSVLLALIGVQLLTGAFLTLYYAPTPDHAYDSVRFITATAAGRLVRGLHHYGATFLIIALVAHMLRVIVFGSYKPPREAIWLTGLALLGLVLAFALTGYLLPWDQRAYWATVVGMNITANGPFVGTLLGQIMQGGPAIGPDTLSRFYSLHMLVAPGLIFALIGLHLYLVIRLGVTSPPWSKEAAGSEHAEREPEPQPRAGLVAPTTRGRPEA